MTIKTAYKVFTHDLCPPIQGGAAVWDGALPHTLPRVDLDRDNDECAAGWNACAKLHTALRIAGLWPNGRPSRAFRCETDDAVCVARGDKLRAETWTMTAECGVEEIADAIRIMSRPFGALADAMVVSQLAWREALAKPLRDVAVVERELAVALHCRGLGWATRRFDDARAAGAARAAWDAWDAWDARAAGDAWDARAAWAARDAWAAWDAWGAWAARDAWAAWAAMIVEFAARSKWTNHDPDLLTLGLREAYRHGLEIAIPTGPSELGWAMVTR